MAKYGEMKLKELYYKSLEKFTDPLFFLSLSAHFLAEKASMLLYTNAMNDIESNVSNERDGDRARSTVDQITARLDKDNGKSYKYSLDNLSIRSDAQFFFHFFQDAKS